MKRHGIIEALNDINKFSEFFETLPSKGEDRSSQSQMNPDTTGSPNNTENSSQIFSNSMVNGDQNQRLITLKREEHKGRFNENKVISTGSNFLFPFQRRARSHSPPSEEQIHKKIAEAMNNNIKPEKERSWSKNLDFTQNSKVQALNSS